MKSPATTTWSGIWTNTSPAPASRRTRTRPCSRPRRAERAGSRANALWQQDAYRMIQRRAKAAGIQNPDREPHLPRHRHHRLPEEQRHAGDGAAHRQPRVPTDHQALRPAAGGDFAGRGGTDRHLGLFDSQKVPRKPSEVFLAWRWTLSTWLGGFVLLAGHLLFWADRSESPRPAG